MRNVQIGILALLFMGSLSASPVLLDFSSSTFTADSDPVAPGVQAFVSHTNYTSGTFRWANIANVGGTNVDILGTVVGGTYRTNIAASTANGFDGVFGRLILGVGRSVDMNFTLVDPSSGDAPVVADHFQFGVFDIDSGTSPRHQSVELIAPLPILYAYTTTVSTGLIGGGPSFTAGGGERFNPTDPTSMTTGQEDHTVLFSFADTAGFDLRFGVGGPVGIGGRSFLFAGQAVFAQPTITGGTIPEPGTVVSLACLLLVGATFFRRFRCS